MPSSRPSLTEVRAVSQPPELIGRRSAEHWAGRLYMRRISAAVTRWVIPTAVTPDQLTVLMIVVGLIAAAIATIPQWWTALATLVLVQAYLLLDCVDGELARWRGTTSATGVFLDRIGHYVVEASLLTAIGIRADGGLTAMGGWTSVGLAAALLHLLAKAETDLVDLARVREGLGLREDETARRPPTGALRRLRRVVDFVPFHRVLGAVELSIALLLVASLATLTDGGLLTWFVGSLALVAGIVAVGHAVMIVRSGRLR